jgi:hypothetical protein
MNQTKTICTIEGCGARATAKGLCAKHYMRTRRHGDPNQTKPRGAPRNAWKASVREMMSHEMSERSFNRYFGALKKMTRTGFTKEAAQETIAEATRPNGSLNYSKLVAITDFVVKAAAAKRKAEARETEAALKERARKLGYKIRRRGDQYHLISRYGSESSGDMQATMTWLDMLESGRPIALYTACGMPISEAARRAVQAKAKAAAAKRKAKG